jgi:hypothetical protein
MMVRSGYDRAVDRVLTFGSDLAIRQGPQGVRAAEALDDVRQAHQERRAYAVGIVLIVAVAVVAAIGIMAYVAIYCINRGGSYSGGLDVDRKGWKFRLKFKCSV